MATTSHESDFDWVKRQGKEFLAAWEAGTGSESGPARNPSGATAGFQDLRALSSRAKDSLLAVAGGTAIVVGSRLPWVAFNDAEVEAKAASVVLGLVVAALGFALRRAPAPGRRAAGIAMVWPRAAGPLSSRRPCRFTTARTD
jgi:hypothetical protein